MTISLRDALWGVLAGCCAFGCQLAAAQTATSEVDSGLATVHVASTSLGGGKEPGCEATPACGCETVCGCGAGGLGGGWCDLGDPWTLFGTHEASGIAVGGWMQAGYTNYDTGMFNNHPYSLDLNQAWIYAEKVADTEDGGFDWGFRIDYLYGTDGPDTQAFGNRPNTYDFGWNNGNFYGHALPQVYGELAYDKVSVKLGHFYTIIGYEVVPATGNFFYSHAFTMYNAEPFTHTGALATYQANEDVTLWGGWTAGWDTGFDTYGGDAFLGGASLALLDNLTFTYALMAGTRGFDSDATGYGHSLVFDLAITDQLNYVFQSDYNDYDATNAADALSTIGINQYLFYSLNDCVAVGARLEWWQRQLAAGDKADLYEVTVGLNVKPHANVMLRPEIRWDRDNDGLVVPAAHNDSLGFGMDAIFTF